MMGYTAAGLFLVLIVLASIFGAVYESARHGTGHNPGVYMPDPHGTALPGM